MASKFYQESGYLFNKRVCPNCIDQLIKNNTVTVGYLIVTFGFSLQSSGKDVLIDELFILKKFRGKGIGSKTIDFIKKNAIDQGIKMIYLEVEKNNIVGQHLYKKHHLNLLVGICYHYH